MPTPEGKIIEMLSPDKVRVDWLESLPYEGNPQMVEYFTDEFSAVCPFSGLPDLGDVAVRYVPEAKIVELKSLKYYFISFRNVGIYQEDVTNRIYNDLNKLLEPKFIEVKTRYKTRGGIKAECSMRSNAQMTTEPIDIR